MSDMTKHVHDLIVKSAEAPQSENAMRFSQAAVNAANALLTLDAARCQPAPRSA